MRYQNQYGVFDGTPEEIKAVLRMRNVQDVQNVPVRHYRKRGVAKLCPIDGKKFYGTHKTCSKRCARIAIGRAVHEKWEKAKETGAFQYINTGKGRRRTYLKGL